MEEDSDPRLPRPDWAAYLPLLVFALAVAALAVLALVTAQHTLP